VVVISVTVGGDVTLSQPFVFIQLRPGPRPGRQSAAGTAEYTVAAIGIRLVQQQWARRGPVDPADVAKGVRSPMLLIVALSPLDWKLIINNEFPKATATTGLCG
jgi:hypothetical protein